MSCPSRQSSVRTPRSRGRMPLCPSNPGRGGATAWAGWLNLVSGDVVVGQATVPITMATNN
eukprot:15439878-Alexandrium_andersonii.AAC.1